MPQVDHEKTLASSVRAGVGDHKISCETLATTDTDPHDDPETRPVSVLPPVYPPQDFPPESFFLSREEELDWLTHNAFFERKESQKGNSANSNSNSNPNPNPSSQQQTALKAKAFMTGLPNPQKIFLEPKNRRQNEKLGQTRLIADLVGSRGRKGTPLSEPSSPKVSCIGRVRSQRSRRIRRGKSNRSDSGVTGTKSGSVNRVGLLSSFRSIFRRNRPVGSSADTHDIRQRLPPDDVSADSPPARKNAAFRKSFEVKPVGNSGLGELKRFASGRRPDLMGAIDVESSLPYDLKARGSQSRDL